MTTLQITHQGNEPIKTQIEHPQQAGFSDIGTPRPRHCGRWAQTGQDLIKNQAGHYVYRHALHCTVCGITVLSWIDD